jgi:hypothetical protein
MLGFLQTNLGRFTRALRKDARIHTEGRYLVVEIQPVQKWEILVGLELLTQLDEVYLRAHPQTPLLYKAQVSYQLEPPGVEDWLTTPVLYQRGIGDCEDLACALCAERRVRGFECNPHVEKHGHVWHITARAGELIEDPSRVLGMGR